MNHSIQNIADKTVAVTVGAIDLVVNTTRAIAKPFIQLAKDTFLCLSFKKVHWNSLAEAAKFDLWYVLSQEGTELRKKESMGFEAPSAIQLTTQKPLAERTVQVVKQVALHPFKTVALETTNLLKTGVNFLAAATVMPFNVLKALTGWRESAVNETKHSGRIKLEVFDGYIPGNATSRDITVEEEKENEPKAVQSHAPIPKDDQAFEQLPSATTYRNKNGKTVIDL